MIFSILQTSCEMYLPYHMPIINSEPEKKWTLVRRHLVGFYRKTLEDMSLWSQLYLLKNQEALMV